MGLEEKKQVPFRGTAEQERQLLDFIEEHKQVGGCLMPIMQKAQEIYGYLPEEVQKMIADAMGIPMEEAHEFLDRVQNDGVLPMITSCSPGWVKYCENYYPNLIPNLSTCKSPQQMFGAVLKTYFAKKQNTISSRSWDAPTAV